MSVKSSAGILDGEGYYDPTATIAGEVVLGERLFVGPGATVRAEAGHKIEIKGIGSVGDNASVLARKKDVRIGERVTIAQNASVVDSRLGNGAYIGYAAVVENAVLHEGVLVMPGARVRNVTVPPGRIVPPGATIDEPGHTTVLYTGLEPEDTFKAEQLAVGQELIRGYRDMVKDLGESSVVSIGPNPITSWNKRYEQPAIGVRTEVAASARVIGRASIGQDAIVGEHASIRADEGMPIQVGANSELGQRVSLHSEKEKTLIVGERVRVGDRAVLRGPLTLGDDTIVGKGAVIISSELDREVTIGDGAIILGVRIRDGSYVPKGKVVALQRDADVLKNQPDPEPVVEEVKAQTADTPAESAQATPAAAGAGAAATPVAAVRPAMPGTGRGGTPLGDLRTALAAAVGRRLSRRRLGVAMGALSALGVACAPAADPRPRAPRPAQPVGDPAAAAPTVAAGPWAQWGNLPVVPTRAVATPTSVPAPVAAPVAPTATPVPRPAVPARLRIGALGIDAAVVPVGLDERGRMADPEASADVAWYEGGARTGEAGHAVFAGHVDRWNQQPAVFARLVELAPGQAVEVVNAAGATARYVVAAVETVAPTEEVAGRVFGPAPAPALCLVTCAGRFDPIAREYDRRLVVTARLA